MGLKRQPEDFGQTLGHYGVGNGSYLVPSVLGPSNVRDATAFAADAAASSSVGPSAWINEFSVSAAMSRLANES